jgi:DNA invertase Pin-like site-specific DNA recombinase
MQEQVYPTDARLADPTTLAVGLIRVSAVKQEREGYSLADQEKRVRTYAEERGLELLSIEDDTWSGMHLSRPGLDRVITLAYHHPGLLVVVVNTDRFVRGGPADGFYLKKMIELAGGRVAFIDEGIEPGAVGVENDLKLFIGFWQGSAYRETMMANLAKGKRAKIAAGKLPGYGPAPYGYTWVLAPKGTQGRNERILVRVALAIDPITSLIVLRIFAEALAGRSLRGIAAGLDADGVATPGRAACWYPTVVRAILRNPVYCGDAYANRWTTVAPTRRSGPDKTPDGRPITLKKNHNIERPIDERTPLPDVAPAIVDRLTWTRAQATLDENRASLRRPPADAAAALLRRRARCGVCGRLMTPEAAGDRSGRSRPPDRRRYYRCTAARRKPEPCSHRALVPAGWLEDEVWAAVEALLTQRWRMQAYLDELDQAPAAEATGQAAARSSLATLEAERDNLRANLKRASGSTADWIFGQLAALEPQLARAAARLADYGRATDERAMRRAQFAALMDGLEALEARLPGIDAAGKRGLLDDLDVRVRVFPTADGPRWEGEWDGGRLVPAAAYRSQAEQLVNNSHPGGWRLPLRPAAAD